MHANVRMEGQCDETRDDKEGQQGDFADGEDVAELFASADAAIVHRREESGKNR
jgi:hypothetical protein